MEIVLEKQDLFVLSLRVMKTSADEDECVFSCMILASASS